MLAFQKSTITIFNKGTYFIEQKGAENWLVVQCFTGRGVGLPQGFSFDMTTFQSIKLVTGDTILKVRLM